MQASLIVIIQADFKFMVLFSYTDSSKNNSANIIYNVWFLSKFHKTFRQITSKFSFFCVFAEY